MWQLENNPGWTWTRSKRSPWGAAQKDPTCQLAVERDVADAGASVAEGYIGHFIDSPPTEAPLVWWSGGN